MLFVHRSNPQEIVRGHGVQLFVSLTPVPRKQLFLLLHIFWARILARATAFALSGNIELRRRVCSDPDEVILDRSSPFRVNGEQIRLVG